jgi:hypothetical protein
MSYLKIRESVYRMPTHFGPAPGPRQQEDGSPRGGNELSPHTYSTAVSFRSDPDQLQALLPPRFTLNAPIVTVSSNYLKELDWLAGRGYNVVTVSVPVTFHGRTEEISANLNLVTWENLADPIITGREELGYPKIYGEIPDLEWDRSRARVRTQVGWGGSKFLEYQITDLVPQPVEGVSAERPPSIYVKYLPATGDWGETDICYVTVLGVPKPGSEPAPAKKWVKLLAKYTGQGSVTFRHVTWEEMPTMSHVINTLADLRVAEIVSATFTETLGGAGLRGMRKVEDLDLNEVWTPAERQAAVPAD